MKAPHKEALLKALEQIIEVADASIAAATGTQPIRPVQLVPILAHGHEQIRSLARAARGDRRWGRVASATASQRVSGVLMPAHASSFGGSGSSDGRRWRRPTTTRPSASRSSSVSPPS